MNNVLYKYNKVQQDKMCWIINLQRKILKLQTMEYKKYSSFTFIDPNKNIFGFFVKSNNVKEKIQMKSSGMKMEVKGNHQFYRNYVQAQNKSYQSKRGSFQGNYINLNSDSKAQTDRIPGKESKPYTPHISVTLTPSHKKQSLRSSMDYNVKYNPNLTMTMGRNSINMQKLANSTHIPGHYSKMTPKSSGKGNNYSEDLKVRATRAISGKQSDTMRQSYQDKFYNKPKQVFHK